MAKSWWQPPRLRVTEDTDEERHATWLELFYDLVFVVAVAQVAHQLNHDLSWTGFLKFIALFIPVWWSWIGFAFYATRFDADDTTHRLLTAIQIIAVAALAVNVPDALGRTSVGFALSYATVRFILVFEYLRAGRHVPQARRLIRRYSRGFALAAFLWLASVFIPIPYRFVFWAAGLLMDFGTPLTAGQMHAQLPPHTSHLPERFGLFTIIVLGETVAGVVRGVSEQQWNPLSSVTAIVGMTIGFSLWWLYFENAGGMAIRAALKAGRIWTYQAWLYAHLFLAIGITACGVGTEHAVLSAHRTALPADARWLIGGSLVICLLSLAVIHLTTASETGSVRLRSESGAELRIGASFVVILITAVGINLLPVALVFLFALICIGQVIYDFYEKEGHSNT